MANPSAAAGITVNLRMDLSPESLERLCDGLTAAVKPDGGYRAITTDDDIVSGSTGEQQINAEWWLPEYGCDSLENTLDSIKGRLLAAVQDWLPTAMLSTPQPEPGKPAGDKLMDIACATGLVYCMGKGRGFASSYEEDTDITAEVLAFAHEVLAKYGNFPQVQ